MSDARLAELAEAVGLQLDWLDANNCPQRVSPETQRALLESLGYPTQSPKQLKQSLAQLHQARLDPTVSGLLVAECGQTLERPLGPPGMSGELLYEDGTHMNIQLDANGCLPAQGHSGYGRLALGEHEWALAVAPPTCPTLSEISQSRQNRWGLAAQLYSLRRSGDGGLGDSAALEELLRSAARQGADAIAISPVHAPAPVNNYGYSPYSPSSRLFFNVLHAAPATILGAAAVEQAIQRAGLGTEMARLESQALIDWPAATNLRMRLLKQLYHDFLEHGSLLYHDLAEFRRSGGEALLDHCRFEVLQTQICASGGTPDWRQWPESLRNPTAVAFRTDYEEEEVSFRVFTQWLIQRCLQHAQSQAREAGMAIGIIADLAVGTDGGGSQAWSRQNEMLTKVNIGAPPDPINQAGQDWGISPFSPEGLRRHGYRAFREMLQVNLAWPGGLRIDHVMGLQRLWLIPRGESSKTGAYLRYPLRELLRLLTLEAARVSALIIGEDLGTVPAGLREELARRHVLGTRVLLFEQRGERFIAPSEWPADAIASTTTHDLPSLTGWWRERDIHWRLQAGHYNAEQCEADRRQRLAARKALAASLELPVAPDQVVPLDACIEYVGTTPAPLVLLPLEDALGSEEQPNLPGPGSIHPNWRRRWTEEAAQMLEASSVSERLRRLNQRRRSPSDWS